VSPARLRRNTPGHRQIKTAAEGPQQWIGHACIGEFGEARAASGERDRDAVLRTDLPFAAKLDVRPVCTRAQQGATSQRYASTSANEKPGVAR